MGNGLHSMGRYRVKFRGKYGADWGLERAKLVNLHAWHVACYSTGQQRTRARGAGHGQAEL